MYGHFLCLLSEIFIPVVVMLSLVLSSSANFVFVLFFYIIDVQSYSQFKALLESL